MQAPVYTYTEVYSPVFGYSLQYLTSFVKSLLAKLSKKEKQQPLNKHLYNCYHLTLLLIQGLQEKSHLWFLWSAITSKQNCSL